MAVRRITRAQREEIAQRREAGQTCEAIAKAIGCSRSNVSWICLMEGADVPGAKPAPAMWSGPLVMQRNGFPVRRFTPEDDARLLALEADGLNPSQLGRALGRPPNSIRARLAILARRDARAEAA